MLYIATTPSTVAADQVEIFDLLMPNVVPPKVTFRFASFSYKVVVDVQRNTCPNAIDTQGRYAVRKILFFSLAYLLAVK